MASISPRKPSWLKVRFPAGNNYARIDRLHREQGLNSVCRSAACPNQGECWSRGTATFMILGDRCTRDCRFCNVIQAPPAKPDPSEPQRVAAAVAELGLNHAVITSVTRDDLADGGARQFAEVTQKIRDLAPDCRIELLIPDLQGDSSALRSLLEAAPDLWAITWKPCRDFMPPPVREPIINVPWRCCGLLRSWRRSCRPKPD